MSLEDEVSPPSVHASGCDERVEGQKRKNVEQQLVGQVVCHRILAGIRSGPVI